jgi:hypothetical protein
MIREHEEFTGSDTKEQIDACLNCTKEKCDNCLCGIKKRGRSAKERFIDITGQRFGSWTAIKRVKPNTLPVYWLCRCDCGTEAMIIGSALRRGKSTGCIKCRELRKKELK